MNNCIKTLFWLNSGKYIKSLLILVIKVGRRIPLGRSVLWFQRIGLLRKEVRITPLVNSLLLSSLEAFLNIYHFYTNAKDVVKIRDNPHYFLKQLWCHCLWSFTFLTFWTSLRDLSFKLWLKINKTKWKRHCAWWVSVSMLTHSATGSFRPFSD